VSSTCQKACTDNLLAIGLPLHIFHQNMEGLCRQARSFTLEVSKRHAAHKSTYAGHGFASLRQFFYPPRRWHSRI